MNKRKAVITDTGFWVGLLYPNDQLNHREASQVYVSYIEGFDILFPWPCLHEALRTKYCRYPKSASILEEYLSLPNIEKVAEEPYKEAALKHTLQNIKKGNETHSLCDSIIREILKDDSRRIDYLITYNQKDFKDICDKRGIEIYGAK